MNNYLNGDDMWPYVTMWEYEERIIPLQKIVDIFHESCNQKLKGAEHKNRPRDSIFHRVLRWAHSHS